MKRSLIQIIFNSMELIDNDFLKADPNYMKLLSTLADMEKEVIDTFQDPEKSFFKSYDDVQSNLNDIMCEMYFNKGFQLGIQILVEGLELDYDFIDIKK